jgi:hypothetical protein
LKRKYFQFDCIQITIYIIMSLKVTEIFLLAELGPSFMIMTLNHYDQNHQRPPYNEPTLAFQPYWHCLISVQPQPFSCLRYLFQPCYHISPPSQVTFSITKFILSIIFVMAYIWNLSSPSGGGGLLFWSNMMVPAKFVSGIKISSHRSCVTQT